jgi:hypothetical protein
MIDQMNQVFKTGITPEISLEYYTKMSKPTVEFDDYYEMVQYLKTKYGSPKLPHFTEDWIRNVSNTRTDENLMIHNDMECLYYNLSNPDKAKKYPSGVQLLGNLT